MLEYSYFVFELIALSTAMFVYRSIKNNRFIYFIPYLTFVVIYEYGSIKNWFLINKNNLWITNITLFVFFLFYSIFILNLIKTPKYIHRIKAAIFLSGGFAIINAALIQGFWNLNSLTITLQFLILILIVCIYFYELMNLSVAKLNIAKLPSFWLCSGLLFFCLIEFLFYSAYAYMSFTDDFKYFTLFEIISNPANFILYSCLTVSFLCIKSNPVSLSTTDL